MSNSNEIFITFLLAIVGYAGLSITLLLSLIKKIPVTFWRVISIIILLHVIMVWSFRYEWQFYLSIRNGYAGFMVFHSALLLILISNFVKERSAKILIILSFIAITMGAIGAVFKYDVVAVYKIPILFCAAAGSGGLLWSYFKR